MSLLYSFFGLLFIYSFFSLTKYKNIEKIMLPIFFLLLFLIAALRGEINGDYMAYTLQYNDYNLFSAKMYTQYEFAHNFLLKVSYEVFGNVQFVFILYALLTIILAYRLIKKYSNNKILSTFIFYIVFFNLNVMVQIRAGLASIIILYSLTYLNKNKLIFTLLVLVAAMFHNSAYVAIFLLILPKEISKKTIIRLLILSIVVGFMLKPDILETIVPPFLMFRIIDYLEIENINFGFGNIVTLFYLVIIVINLDELRDKNKYFDVFLKAYLLGVYWQYVFINMGMLGGRGSAMVIESKIILFPMLLRLKKYKLLVFFLILLQGLYVVRVYNPYEFGKYLFFWE